MTTAIHRDTATAADDDRTSTHGEKSGWAAATP